MDDHCFLDTTLLVEALLKTTSRRRRARSTIRQFKRSTLPVYAVKEFKAGALANYVWLHNHLAETRSLAKTYSVLTRNMRRPGRVSTSLEALEAASAAILGSDLATAQTSTETDRLTAETLMLEIRRLILKAWADRRKICTETAQELACFVEDAPYYDDETGMIFLPNTKCPKDHDCSYAPGLRVRKKELDILLQVIKGSTRAEDNRRRAALHTLKNTPKRIFDDSNCRSLGDAYFALHCPQDATILTSNVKDHKPLAESLGRTVTEYVFS
jgi:hypothetical protein